ncbi:MAG: hypothetical protein GZ091_03745, partial [Paludibacter sp.]|nr:hypothetical protein [Paludibacter sp.]
MKQKRMKMGALLLLGLGLTAVQAQRMNVKTKSGTNTAYMISDIRNMTYSGANLVVTKVDASTTSFAIPDTRFINYSTGMTSTWNGTRWIPSAPTALDNAIFNGNYSAAGFPCDNLTVNAGKQLTIASGNMAVGENFVLRSDATNGTATLIDNGNLTVGGTSSVEQYLTVARQWWYLSSPLSAAKTTTFTDATRTNKIGNYDEISTSYSAPLATNVPLTAGKGYVVKLSDATDGIYTFTGGSLITGDVTLAPTRTGTTAGKRGFNLVGNPYPSYLDWNAAYTAIVNPISNLRNAIWYRTFDGAAMTFYTYSDGEGVPATVTKMIPPMQAFWIKVNQDGTPNSTGSITFKNAYRAHATSTANPLKVKAVSDRQKLRLVVANGTNTDETLIVGKSYASDNYDSYDIEKMSNDNPAIPEIFSMVDNQELVINSVNQLSVDKVINLGFRPGQTGDFTIRATEIQQFRKDSIYSLAIHLINIPMNNGHNTPLSKS